MNTMSMTSRRGIDWKALGVCLLISLGTGIASGIITSSSMDIYVNELIKPPLSPPGLAFPIVWTILFVLMGISSYMIYESVAPTRKRALTLFVVQLAVNFFWMIFFFNLRLYLFAFFWLIFEWILVFSMIRSFRKINIIAGNMQIPYLVWLSFAAHLNLAIYILN